MVDTNMITAYFWACGIFQPDLPSALSDVDKRTKFVNEVNEVLLKYINNDINSKGHGHEFAIKQMKVKYNSNCSCRTNAAEFKLVKSMSLMAAIIEYAS